MHMDDDAPNPKPSHEPADRTRLRERSHVILPGMFATLRDEECPAPNLHHWCPTRKDATAKAWIFHPQREWSAAVPDLPCRHQAASSGLDIGRDPPASV